MPQIPHNELQLLPLDKKHNLSSFNSTNTDLNEFLKNDALGTQDDLVNKTYLCFWQNSIVGYITFTTDTLEVRVVEESDGVEDYPHRKYPCMRIARLAVDRGFERCGIGRFLLFAAIGIAIDISDRIGCRYITVDSKPESISFYEKHGFKLIEGYRNSEFPKMYLNMYPIITKLQPKQTTFDSTSYQSQT
jgi:GNAT superfamily N-acetyltransferase